MTETEAAMFERLRDQAEFVARIHKHNEQQAKITAENWIRGGELQRLVAERLAGRAL
jgi:hypothetical protein